MEEYILNICLGYIILFFFQIKFETIRYTYNSMYMVCIYNMYIHKTQLVLLFCRSEYTAIRAEAKVLYGIYVQCTIHVCIYNICIYIYVYIYNGGFQEVLHVYKKRILTTSGQI